VKVVQRVPVKIVFDEIPDSTIILPLGASVVPKVKVK
jgi:multidrug resistance efflux pump